MSLPNAATSAVIQLPLPIGSVISYMGSAATLSGLVPLGWLLCDGSSFSSATYPDLYATIGVTYGGNGSPNFAVPDLRGLFLRSVDPTGILDPDCQTRESPIPNNATVVGPVVGSRQWFQVQNHQHNWNSNFGQISWNGSDLNVQLAPGSPNGGNQGTQPTTDNDGGGAETRPVNAYAYFLIFSGLPQTTSS